MHGIVPIERTYKWNTPTLTYFCLFVKSVILCSSSNSASTWKDAQCTSVWMTNIPGMPIRIPEMGSCAQPLEAPSSASLGEEEQHNNLAELRTPSH